jgi:hypothetical protein
MAGKIEKDLKQAEIVGIALSESREFDWKRKSLRCPRT